MSLNQSGAGKGHLWYHGHWDKSKETVWFLSHGSLLSTILTAGPSSASWEVSHPTAWEEDTEPNSSGELLASCHRETGDTAEGVSCSHGSPWRVAHGQAVVRQGPGTRRKGFIYLSSCPQAACFPSLPSPRCCWRTRCWRRSSCLSH